MSTLEEHYPLTMQDMALHDPFVLVDQGRGLYCLYQANYRMRWMARPDDPRMVLLYLSPDMQHFSLPIDVLNRNDYPPRAWFDDSDAPWAPEVHSYRGAYWMFLTMPTTLTQPCAPTAGPDWFIRSGSIRRGRGMALAVAESPEGPFRLLPASKPLTGAERLALDGTLVLDRCGDPWMVYAHEWVQIFDGSMEAVRLDKDDLSLVKTDPIHLWYSSQASWHREDCDAPEGGWGGDFSDYDQTVKSLQGHPERGYVTDGPWMIDDDQGGLVCLWSSYRGGTYTLTQAFSQSGRVQGPWRQLDLLDSQDAGHAQVFAGLTGEHFLLMHTNMTRRDPSGHPMRTRGLLYQVSMGESGLRLERHRSDLDGLLDPASGQ